jgi:hypothetical protein
MKKNERCLDSRVALVINYGHGAVWSDIQR